MSYSHIHDVKVGDSVTMIDGSADTFTVSEIIGCDTDAYRLHIDGRCVHINSLILINE